MVNRRCRERIDGTTPITSSVRTYAVEYVSEGEIRLCPNELRVTPDKNITKANDRYSRK